MFRHPLFVVLSSLVLIAASPAVAQGQGNQSEEKVTVEMRCGGQYECVEERLLTHAEARTTIAYPADAAEDATKVASTPQKPAN
jgi:hypothetical protein